MKFFIKSILILLAIWVAFELITHLTVEMLWFQEVKYLGTFLKRFLWQFGLLIFTTGFSVLFLLGNLHLAERLKWQITPENNLNKLTEKKSDKSYNLTYLNQNLKLAPAKTEIKIPNIPQSPALTLPLLLTIVLGLSLVIGIMLFESSQAAFIIWTPNYTLPNISPTLPSPFEIRTLPQLLAQFYDQAWQLVIVTIIFLLILFKPRFWLRAISLILSLIFGAVISGNWARILHFFYGVSFNKIDPQFNKDIGFYVFNLPIWKLLDFWLGGLFLYGLIAVTLIYLRSGDSISQGKFPGLSRPQLRHLYVLGGLVMLILGFRHARERYELLYSSEGIVYGANYTDINIRLPIQTILTLFATGIAFWLFYKAINKQERSVKSYSLNFKKYAKKDNYISLSFILFSVYFTFIIGGFITAEIVQDLIVEPNQLAREKPYIKRSIAFTRAAFNLDTIEEKELSARGKLSLDDLQKNLLTLNNIRLWDTRPLLQTNRQLQQIRLYYKFPGADIDRYTIKAEQDSSQFTNTKQQVLIAARELDYKAVPQQAKTWVNEHLVYTHGYGFTLSPVNLVDQGGLPFYFVKDIGTDTEDSALKTSSELIRGSIPIKNPRIYYGELTDTYIMTNTVIKNKELDFPKEQDNVYNTYQGTGGIKIKSWGRRILFSEYLKDWQMLFTKNFSEETKILFRRNINQRIRKIAPFLHYDHNPYLVVATPEKGNPEETKTSLYWIVDAYTTSDRYPYSDPGNRDFNYIRNSVKIVIDAYNGDVDFYLADQKDPLIQTWNNIFPELFKPLEAMPKLLRQHIRYPEDLFSTQSERLLTYHMTDPQVFYNREDQWQIPQEIYGSKQQRVEPYYLILKLTEASEEFVLTHVYTPTSRNNLIALLFGRSDGKEYGKMLLYQLPKQRLIYGPEQIEALINQNPVISQQISLWNREGSRVLQGNLLVIPIEQSLLYVEPLYLEAEKNSLPTLVKVIVVYENRIVMADSLKKALKSIFNAPQASASAIVRTSEKISNN